MKGIEGYGNNEQSKMEQHDKCYMKKICNILKASEKKKENIV